MKRFGREKTVFIKNRYRAHSLAAHQERTSAGAALLQGQGLFSCYMDINLRPVIILGQGRKKKINEKQWNGGGHQQCWDQKTEGRCCLFWCPARKKLGHRSQADFREEMALREELPGKN